MMTLLWIAVAAVFVLLIAMICGVTWWLNRGVWNRDD